MPEPTTLTGRLESLRRRRAAPLILDLDLTEGIALERPSDPVSAVLNRRRPLLSDIVDGLRRARRDQRVRALVAKVGGRPIGLATVQELRRAVEEFRDAGKITLAWAETFGEFSPGNVPYYLATAFETIMLQPSGDLGLTGVTARRLFFRGTLDRLGVDVQVAKRHEYKSAAEQFTERELSGPAREAVARLTASLVGQLIDAIADRRRMTAERARELIDEGPFLAADAWRAGLVDELGYRDEVYARVRKQAGGGAVVQPLLRYRAARALADQARQLPARSLPAISLPGVGPAGTGPYVALIHATGPIRRGRSGRPPLASPAIGSDTLAAAIRSAAADSRARAIVLRVNSPGGSYVASDTIWREVVRARAAGTPVVVSMGDVAASGGYYISMAADAIVAQPGTITGSIGVLTVKPVTRGLLERAGITSDSVSEGAHAEMFDTTRPFTDEEWALVNGWLDHIYADFTGKVAAGRRMTAERVHELARGRVWSGADALENGLVDELGGLERAAALARRRSGLPASAPLRPFPRMRPLDRLRPEPAETPAASLLAEAWGPVWRLAARAGLPAYGPLMLPGVWALE
jgi:protease-4